MDPAKSWMVWSHSSGRRMGSLSVVVLLLFVKTLLRLSFDCTTNVVETKVYSLIYFILPAVFLFSLSLLLRPRRSPGLFSTRCCSFRYFLYVTVQAGKTPLIWILLSMIEDLYLLCFLTKSFPRWTGYEPLVESIQRILQIVGLAGLAILLILDYGVPQSTWAQKYFSYYFRQRNEDLILEEVEVVLQQKLEEKRKAFMEGLIRFDLDQLTPEELFKKGTMPDLVWKYKEVIQKKCAEGSQEPNESRNVI